MTKKAIEEKEVEFDLLQFTNDKLEQSRVFHPTAPTGQELTFIELEIISSSAEEPAQKIEKLTQNQKIKAFKAQREGKLFQMSLDEKKQYDLDCAMAVLVGFKGIKLEGGKELEYSEENKELLLRRFWWITKQVIDKSDTHSFFYTHEEKK